MLAVALVRQRFQERGGQSTAATPAAGSVGREGLGVRARAGSFGGEGRAAAQDEPLTSVTVPRGVGA